MFLDVKKLVSTCDIKKSLLEHRHKIQTLSDETAVSMKKNVYRNYKQFIDTSKEISCILFVNYRLVCGKVAIIFPLDAT